MKSSSVLLLCTILMALTGCGGGGGGGGGGSSSTDATQSSSSVASSPTVAALPNGLVLPAITGDNVLTVTVDGSECSARSLAVWPNKPCVTVTICDSSSGNCQTVDDILLDTGDYGLRIFQQALPTNLVNALTSSQVEVNSLPLYECVEYGDGSTVWGPVQQASVQLGGEPAVLTPVHIIGSSTSDVRSDTGGHACSGSFSSPTDAYYNGSLGVGFRVRDCGSVCASNAKNRWYFTYDSSTNKCTPTAVPVTQQVRNVVSALPVDNNGVTLMFPSVPSTGLSSTNGYLVLGIGTESNNIPASTVQAYGANSSGYFTTVFNSIAYEGFIDSGSNGFFFPDSAIPTNSNSWFTPTSTLSLSATNTAASGSPTGEVDFQIGNFTALSSSGYHVFSNIGGSDSVMQGAGMFDWGLPFFLGRNVCVGIEGSTSSLGTGPYWAYSRPILSLMKSKGPARCHAGPLLVSFQEFRYTRFAMKSFRFAINSFSICAPFVFMNRSATPRADIFPDMETSSL